MAYDDDLRELFDLARRALACQADLGHKEIIFEPRDTHPVAAAAADMSFSSGGGSSSGSADQMSLLQENKPGLGEAQFSSLEDHRQAICACAKCSLGSTRTNFVYGVGNPSAKIMFVGEAPGRDEDLQGEPFVGRAGKLLDKIIEAMGFKRQDVYIGNILKCRPPENRDPQPDEMKTCISYLEEQIRLIKPQFLVCLGRIAAHGLLDTMTPLGKLRGQWHDFRGTPVIVTYHPAALLRFAQYKRPTWEDMQTLLAEYERLNQNK